MTSDSKRTNSSIPNIRRPRQQDEKIAGMVIEVRKTVNVNCDDEEMYFKYDVDGIMFTNSDCDVRINGEASYKKLDCTFKLDISKTYFIWYILRFRLI